MDVTVISDAITPLRILGGLLAHRPSHAHERSVSLLLITTFFSRKKDVPAIDTSTNA